MKIPEQAVEEDKEDVSIDDEIIEDTPIEDDTENAS
jgi:hypothetical protein